jgi:hypothetical protein
MEENGSIFVFNQSNTETIKVFQDLLYIYIYTRQVKSLPDS